LTGSSYNSNTLYNGLSSGDINLFIKDSNGCVYDTTFQLKIVEDLPDDLDLEVYAPACPEGTNGSIEVLSVNGGNGPYEFVLDGISKGSISNYKDLKEGVYSLNVIDANGCEKETMIDLTGGKPLGIDLGPDQEVEAGSSVNINPIITGKDITSIEWSPVICSNCTGLSLTVDRDTIISATIIDAGGCIQTDQLALSIIFKTEIFTPNAFSPNGDGINDSWSLMTANTFAKINKLQIFDRWGGLVFNVANVLPGDKSSSWDGKISGKIVNSGVFVYVAEVNLGNGETVVLKGDITVYR
jgi:gliding motility-associated-like protein